MHILAVSMRALIALPLFFYVPGLLLDRAWLGDDNPLHGIERHANRVLLSVLLTGWLALLLAEAGWFDYWVLVAILLAVSVLLFTFVRRRRTTSNLRPRAAPPLGIVAGRPLAGSAPGSRRAVLAGLRFDHGLLAVTILFALLVARPFEVIRGGLDAGVYANTGISIERTGGIVLHDELVAAIGRRAEAGDVQARQIATNVLGVQPKDRYLARYVRAAGFFVNDGDLAAGRVVPQFFHLWPAWIAVFVSILGPSTGLIATGAAGMLGVVFLGLLGRRLGGPVVGLLAAAFLALITPQVWFSRMPTSEALTQALLLSGLWAFSYFAEATERRARIWWGALVGMAFGVGVLTRIDFVIAVAPLLLLLLYVGLTRRWHQGYTALGLALGLLLAHTVLHIILIARAYFFDTAYHRLQDFAITLYLSLPFLSPDLQAGYKAHAQETYADTWRLPLEVGTLVLVLLALFALWRRPAPILWLERQVLRRGRLLQGAAVAGLAVLAIYGYLIRPGILSADVVLRPLRPDNWLRLQGYIGAPIAVPPGYDKETIALSQANMARLGWYLSPLGVLLGVAGGLLLWWRLSRRGWLFVLVATVYIIFFVRLSYGTGSATYIYILRRNVPLVFPAFVLGMAYVLAQLWGRGRSMMARGLCAGLSLGLLLFFVATGLPAYRHTEYEGALAQVAALSEKVAERDVVLIRGGGARGVLVRDTSELVAAPLTYVYGRNALPIKGRAPAKYPEAFAGQVTRWRDEGRRVFLLLGASGSDMLFPGYALRSVDGWRLSLREFQQLQNQKPKLAYTNELPFHLYELVPAAEGEAVTEVGADDTGLQVAGFYRSEATEAGSDRAAWTDGMAVLRLPGEVQGNELALTVAGGERPQSIGPARLCVDAAPEPVPYPEGDIAYTAPWRELTCGELPAGFTGFPVRIPTLGGDAPLLIRLRSEPWVPSEVPPDPGTPRSTETRELGIRFMRATLR